MATTKRYTYRAAPSPSQQTLIARLLGCVRVVFNDAIALQRQAYESERRFVPQAEVQRRLVTDAKHTAERAWLSEVSFVPLAQATRDADRAWRNFFASVTGRRKGRRVGAPRFKSRRHRRQTARFTRASGFAVRETTHGVGFVRLPKIGWVRFALSRPLPSAPSSVTLIREADGTIHVSFVVIVSASPRAVVHPGRVAGIDLGLTTFASVVYSDGTREAIENPRHLRAALTKLTRLQRALARKRRGSANRDKARLALARAHAHVRNARLNHHHETAARLIGENQAIAVESLEVVGLARSGSRTAQGRGVRRSVSDAGWGQFLDILTQKATEDGRVLVAVNPAYTSQTCSVCGTLDGHKPLGIRTWQCQACGTPLDRDYNAAVNIMVAAGLAETQNACGADVRHALAHAAGDEAGTHRGACAPRAKRGTSPGPLGPGGSQLYRRAQS